MSDTEKKINGLEAIGDDDLEAVAGGKGFKRCDPKGLFEANFPYEKCKGCKELKAYRDWSGGPSHVFTCRFFDRTERKDSDKWRITW